MTTRHAFTTPPDFRLASGAVLPEMTVAYRSMGRLNDRRQRGAGPARLHHRTDHAGSRRQRRRRLVGELVGPGKPIDTGQVLRDLPEHARLLLRFDRAGQHRSGYRAPYGPAFPDIARGRHRPCAEGLLDGLGVTKLAAVAGPSFGAYQSFQWAASYPQLVERVVAAVGAPWHPGRPAPRRDPGRRSKRTRLGRYCAGDRDAMLPYLTASASRP
jgi:homoserine O-acetyltransferase